MTVGTYPDDPEGMYPADHPFWQSVEHRFYVLPPSPDGGVRQRATREEPPDEECPEPELP